MQMRNIENGSVNGHFLDTNSWTIVLEGMGLSTTGFDAGSESPTDPTALVARQ